MCSYILFFGYMILGMKDSPLNDGSGSNNSDNDKDNQTPKGFNIPDHGLTPDQLSDIQKGINDVIHQIINNPPAPVEPEPIEEKAPEEDGKKFFQELRASIEAPQKPDPTDNLPFVMKEGTKGTMCNLYGESVSSHMIYQDQDKTPKDFVKDLLKFAILVALSYKETKAVTQQYLEAVLKRLFSTMPDMKDISFKADTENDQRVLEKFNKESKLITAAIECAGYDNDSAQLLQLALDKKNIDVIKEQRELFARGCEETILMYKPEAYKLFDELTGFDSALSDSLDAKEKYGPLRFVRSQAKRSGYGEPTIYKAIRNKIIPEGAIVRSTPNCSHLKVRDAAVDFFMPQAGIRKRNNPKRKN